MLFLPTYYAFALQPTLKAFPGFTKAQICILHNLHVIGVPASFMILYAIMGGSHLKFYQGMTELVKNGYINRKNVGKTVQYTLTEKGIKLLYEFNATLERIVKEKLMSR